MKSVMLARMNFLPNFSTVPLALLQLVPISALVAVIVFLLREGLEWTRRKKSETRKINAIKKVISRDCLKNIEGIGRLKHAVKSLKEQCANIPESAYHHDSSISPYVVNDLHTALSLIKNDFLDKYLVDIAQTDEKLFIQCSDTLDCLWRVHTRFTETLKEPNIYLQPEVINRPNGYFNYGTKLIYSAEELLKALYERCTGVDLRFDEDKP